MSGHPGPYLRDRQSGTTTGVGAAFNGGSPNGGSNNPVITPDGRHIAYSSSAHNLVPGDNNNAADVFVVDRVAGTVSRVSVATGGGEANGASGRPSITPDGRYIAFDSDATNLVPGDSNGDRDVFVHDRVTGVTERVSVDSSGMQAANLSRVPAISADGRYVTFESIATNLVPGDSNGVSDIFVHDRQTGQTVRVSVTAGGVEGDGRSQAPDISADGRFVAFASQATNLVDLPVTPGTGIYGHDRQDGSIRLASWSHIGQVGGGVQPRLAGLARLVVYTSGGALAPGDSNGENDIYISSFGP